MYYLRQTWILFPFLGRMKVAQLCFLLRRNVTFYSKASSHPRLSVSPLSITHTFLQDMHIISTDEKQVFAAVQEWNQNNTYSLYISDSPGVYFTLSLENLRTSRGPAGNLLVDFYKVRSLSPSWPAAVTAPLIPLPGVSHNGGRSCQKNGFQSLRWSYSNWFFVWPTV